MGHDLTAGGGSSLNRAGELAGIAGLLHQRDGNGAGSHGVAHGGAGHHAAQCGGDNGNLGRTTGSGTGQCIGTVDEERSNACGLKERAEDNEQNDIGGAHTDGRADNTICRVEQIEDDFLQRLACANKGIQHKGCGHKDDRQAHHTAAALDQHQNTYDTKDDQQRHSAHYKHLVDAGAPVHDLVQIDTIEKEADGTGQSQYNIIPGNIVYLLYSALFCRIKQEHRYDHDAQEQRAAEAFVKGGKQVHPNQKQGEPCHQDAQDLGRNAGPDAGVGLAVILFHDCVHISGSTYIHRSGSVDLVFNIGHIRFLLLYFFAQNH